MAPECERRLKSFQNKKRSETLASRGTLRTASPRIARLLRYQRRSRKKIAPSWHEAVTLNGVATPQAYTEPLIARTVSISGRWVNAQKVEGATLRLTITTVHPFCGSVHL